MHVPPLTQLRVDLSLDMILSPRDAPVAVGVLGAVTEGSEASSSVAGTSSAAQRQGAGAQRPPSQPVLQLVSSA